MIYIILDKGDKMTKHIYIFRHGQTDFNLEKRWQGQHYNTKLNKNGVKQASVLADKIKDFGIEIIFTSPLHRAKKTAEIISHKLNIPVVVEDLLIEADLGVAEGLTKDEIIYALEPDFRRWVEENPEDQDFGFENGETKREISDRAWSALKSITDNDFDIIGVSSHGALIRSILANINYKPDSITNTSIFHLTLKDGKWSVIKE